MDDLTLDPVIAAHYTDGRSEDARLRRGAGLVELARTQQVIRRHLPAARLRILDVGGGSGIHAAWLAADGHDVHLVDPVPLHVEQATQVGADPAHPFTAVIGDARRLDEPDAGRDVVLLLGPLYHLTDRADRVRALAEAHRVVAPGGLVVAAAISRFASLFDGLTRWLLGDPAFRDVVRTDLATGQHRNPDERPDWFTTAYFHHPDELAREATDAGLDPVEVVGVEGMSAWSLRADPTTADDADGLAVHVWAAESIEHEPALAGLSPHLLLVARRSPV
jgi:SAM-dependent methyltransferase